MDKPNKQPRTARACRAMLPAMIASVLSATAHAAPSPGGMFDADFFLGGVAPKVDLSRFDRANAVLPGTYRGDILFNERWRTRGEIVFVDDPATGEVVPCFDAASLSNYGVDLQKVAAGDAHPGRKAIPAEGAFCGALDDYIPGATVDFDGGEQALSISVPQVYTRRDARGYVDPALWDSGIDAAVFGYNGNVYRSTGRGGGRLHGYLGINASLSLGGWHAFHLGSMSWTQHQGRRYENNATYLQRDLPDAKAQLLVGDLYTSGQLLDSVRLRGLRLYSDERMLPESQRGYAPVVRGIAETNARVRIKQRGYTIYESTVAPGPFVIDDLYPTGYGGDLDVEVLEADGRVRQFAVPFSAIPQLLRAGQNRWEVAIGKVASPRLIKQPMALQATLQRGLSNRVTAYQGVTLAEGYRSLLLGGALNTDLGALSLDFSNARAYLPGRADSQGNSFRVAYNKNVVRTGTNFAVAAYRYSTRGYLGLNEAVHLRDALLHGQADYVPQRIRNRMDASIYQQLGERGGQVYLTGSRSNFWDKRGRQVDFTAGYSNSWRSATFSLSVQRTRERFDDAWRPGAGPVDGAPGFPEPPYFPAEGRRDTLVQLNVSVPLGTAPRPPMLGGRLGRSDRDGTSTQLSLNGTAGEEGRFTYDGTLGRDGGSTTLGLFGHYNGSRANLQGGYSRGNGYHQFSAGMSGSVVAHGGGLTLSLPTGDTVGLVHAPDAAGARVEGGQGAVVDARGYAVVPYLTPYVLNTVGLDPKGTALNVELKETAQNVAPRAGSVVLLKYETQGGGRALLIDARLPDGRPMPFGAEVFDARGDRVGIVGQASQVFVNGMHESGVLTVRWGQGEGDRCDMQVALPPLAEDAPPTGQERMEATCVLGTEAPGTAAAAGPAPETVPGLRAAGGNDTDNAAARHPTVSIGATP